MPDVQASVLRNVHTSESFVEKVALLVITALLSGFLLPYAIARYNNSVAARLKAGDLARAKNDSIVQAQAKLVEDFASVVLLTKRWPSTCRGTRPQRAKMTSCTRRLTKNTAIRSSICSRPGGL